MGSFGLSIELSLELLWRRVGFSLLMPHLVPGELSVQDGTQTPEAGVRAHLHPVGYRLSRLRRGRLYGTDVVCGLVRPSPPEARQVREAQLLWLQQRQKNSFTLPNCR